MMTGPNCDPHPVQRGPHIFGSITIEDKRKNAPADNIARGQAYIE
jgi:hypothetical protein